MATAAATKETTKLPKSVFGVEVKNHELLKIAYEAYLAEGRAVTAKTKTRGEISGGGRKPWRQKGTGRARFGSTRNPIWRKGGVVFGPRGVENYTKTISTAAKRTAIRQALSLANKADKFVIVSNIKTTGKTKDIAAFIDKQKLTDKRVLIVVDEKTPELIRSSKNIPEVELTRATYLTVFHILNADKIVVTEPALKAVEEWLGGKK
jgi:large subunit ribosomal protein L4